MKKIKDLVSKIVKMIKSSSLTTKIVAGVTTLAVVVTAIVLPQVKLSKTGDDTEDDKNNNNNNDTSTLAKKENSVAPNTAKATEIDATIDDEADEILEAKVEQKEENKKEEEKPQTPSTTEQKPQTPSTPQQKPQTPSTPSTPQQKPQTPSKPQQEQKPQTPSKPQQKPQVTDWKYDASLSAQLQSRFEQVSSNNYGQKDSYHIQCSKPFLTQFFSIANSYFYGNISQSQAETQIKNIDGTEYLEKEYYYRTTDIGSISFDDFTVSSLTSVNMNCESCCFKVAVYTNGSGNFRIKRIILASSTRVLDDDW